MQIDTVNPLDRKDWNRHILPFPGSTIFHTQQWAHLLDRTYKFPLIYLTATIQDRLAGVLPLAETTSLLGKRRGSSLPFSDEVAVLAETPEVAQQLIDQAFKLAKARQWSTLELKGPALKVPLAERTSELFWGHTLDLSVGGEALRAGYDSSVRRALRKAEKLGVQVAWSDTVESMRQYYRLHCFTRRRQGMPPQPWVFFEHLTGELLQAGLGRVVLAQWQGKPIAGAVYLRFGSRAVYKFGASDAAFQHLRANNVVMDAAIQQFAVEGLKSLDFGRTARHHEGLRRFKLSYGSVERFIAYFKHDLVRNRSIVEKDLTSGWHNLIFRWMPLGASRLVGNMIYKHFA